MAGRYEGTYVFPPFSTSAVQSFLHFYLGPALHSLLHVQPSTCQLSSTLMRTTWRMAQSTHKHMGFSPYTHKQPARPHPLSCGSHMGPLFCMPWGFSRPYASTTQLQRQTEKRPGGLERDMSFFQCSQLPLKNFQRRTCRAKWWAPFLYWRTNYNRC